LLEEIKFEHHLFLSFLFIFQHVDEGLFCIH
jgi:hypothetical protein